jgi:hypothetical protein
VELGLVERLVDLAEVGLALCRRCSVILQSLDRPIFSSLLLFCGSSDTAYGPVNVVANKSPRRDEQPTR